MQRPLLLNGFMATGKSTVAEHLSATTGHPWIDLDQRVSSRAGQSVAQLFGERGEGAFRALERAELEGLLKSWRKDFERAPIIALGGGALLNRELRMDALQGATLVSLSASTQEILRRSAQDTSRPLLKGADSSHVTTLLELRKPLYAEAHGSIDTTDLAVDVVAARARDLWERELIAVAAGERSYCVEVGSGLLASRAAELAAQATSVLVISDDTVHELHGHALAEGLRSLTRPAHVALLRPGEEHKNVAALQRLWQAAFDSGADRSSMVLGFGGGVVTDMAGFTAATWMRGVRWCALPTTLLGMVDASVGGKTGVDFDVAKNAVGAFWQPSAVLCDVAVLTTETKRAFTGALAEVVKTALIGDPQLFELCEQQGAAILRRDPAVVRELVRRSIAVKANIVSRDERESGLRAVLNLGHTFGHALEAHGQFTRWTHGEAVALGLGVALRVGVELGVTPPELSSRVERVLERLGLVALPDQDALQQAAELIGHDKKRAGKKLRFVVAQDVGQVDTVTVDVSDLVSQGKRLSNTLAKSGTTLA